MHAAIVHLSPILAAEKSKTPFYIAGGVLVAWALIVSLGLGLREGGFPRTAAAERAVMAVTAVLVVIAVSMAVATSGGSTKAAQAASAGSAAAPSGAGQSAGTSSTSSTGTSSRSRPANGGAAKTSARKSGSTASSMSEAQTKLAQAADPSGQLRFAKTSLTAKAGKVSIAFANSSPLPHNLTIASGTTVLGATPTFNGGSKTLTLKLKAGTYKFYCSVPGHREAGMEGTLVVRP